MKMLHSQSGFATMDFIFALIMSWGVLLVFLALTLTFSIFEVGQYMAFAVGRNYMAGHISEGHQQEAANAKFKQMMGASVISHFFGGTLFSAKHVNQYKFNDAFNAQAGSGQTFEGAMLTVTASVLSKRLPLLGTTNPEDEPFTVNLTGFLGREVTEMECLQSFNARRFENILRLSDGGSNGYAKPQVVPAAYAVVSDNGC